MLKRTMRAGFCAFLFVLGFAGSAQAAVVFDGSPGTAAPPATLGGYTMSAFAADPQPLFANVGGVAGPTGSVGFSPALSHRKIGSGWATWSHGYTGDVYYTNGALSATLTLPANTGAFYLYAEPNPFSSFNITATAQDGSTSGPVSVSGFAGAKYFGFYGTGGDKVVTVTVSSTVDFAVGEFGIATAPTNQAPSVDPISGPTSANEGEQKSYSVSASDPDGDTLSYAWSVTGGNAQISGSSTGSSVDVDFSDGPSTVGLEVEVSDGHGHTVTKTLSVDEANVAPTLSSLALSGASGTACSGGNNVGLDFSFSDPAGANDTYTGAVDWGDGSSNTSFSSSPVSESHAYAAGTYTVKVDVSDEDGGSATQQSGNVSLLWSLGGILQPINQDGSSVFARKKGSTIPVKVRIADCNGNPVGGLAPKIGTSQNDSLVDGDPINETASTSAADTTGQMRYDASGGQYIYNLSTASLATGNWTVYVRQAESSASQVKASFSLK